MDAKCLASYKGGPNTNVAWVQKNNARLKGCPNFHIVRTTYQALTLTIITVGDFNYKETVSFYMHSYGFCNCALASSVSGVSPDMC